MPHSCSTKAGSSSTGDTDKWTVLSPELGSPSCFLCCLATPDYGIGTVLALSCSNPSPYTVWLYRITLVTIIRLLSVPLALPQPIKKHEILCSSSRVSKLSSSAFFMYNPLPSTNT
ncbi:hypothetical protein TcG_04394 [Trypanosoma cruzi]|nr:hypothetical protein TcG_04394 [Trypanosoma cruzi]